MDLEVIKAKPVFNLLYEPWITAVTQEGERKEVSICDVFKNASQYHSLAGELPAQNTAVLRLLLAILHSAFSSFDDADEAIDFWVDTWKKGSFPYESIISYLMRYENRFWLFHPDTPFYQTPGLDKRADVFGPFDISKMNGVLSESDNKVRLIPQRQGGEKNSLSYAEAVRWLLYFNGFAESFGKLESKCKANKNDPTLGVGWLGKLGLITAAGDNFFKTLMLNYIPLNNDGELWEKGKPIWEKPINYKERNYIPLPGNQAELLTLQSRRVLLERKNDRVVSFRFVSGDFFSQEEAFSEQMTTWRYTKQQKDKTERYRPRPFQPSVQLWRDFSCIVEQNMKDGRLVPGVVRWPKYLINSDIDDNYADLFKGNQIRYQTSGITYGTMQAVINDVFSDSLSFNAGLLSEMHEGWLTRIIEELEITKKLVWETAVLAQAIAKAAGIKDGNNTGKPDGYSVREETRTQAFYKLDMPFRLWLEAINPEKDKIGNKCEEWWNISRSIIRTYGRELIYNCPPQALTGKTGQSAPEAYNWFLINTKDRDTLTREIIPIKRKNGGEKRGRAANNNT